MTHLDIMKRVYDNERQRVIDKAQQLAGELASAATMIAKAAEDGDLNRIAWTVGNHDAELATRATVLRENLQMLAGLPESLVFCQGCQQRIPYGPTSKDIERYANRLCGACEELRAREKAGQQP